MSGFLKRRKKKPLPDNSEARRFLTGLRSNPFNQAAHIEATEIPNWHMSFEAYAATRIQTVVDNFPSSHARYYNFTLSHSPGELVHQAAVTAKGYAAQANDPSRTNWASVADTTLANAACYSAALLYKFAKEVHMI